MNHSEWTQNVGGDAADVTVDVEWGVGVFLSMSCPEIDLDLVINDDVLAQEFFQSVADAKKRWDELK